MYIWYVGGGGRYTAPPQPQPSKRLHRNEGYCLVCKRVRGLHRCSCGSMVCGKGHPLYGDENVWCNHSTKEEAKPEKGGCAVS